MIVCLIVNEQQKVHIASVLSFIQFEFRNSVTLMSLDELVLI